MRSILWMAALALAVACGSAADEAENAGELAEGVEYTGTAASLLERGMTQDEVRNRLGEPLTRVTMNSGQERWTYYAYDPQGQLVARTLILFGNDGTIVEVNHGQR